MPDGFVVTTDAYRFFLERSNLIERIEEVIKSAGEDFKSASTAITNLIEEQPVPGAVADAIREALRRLGEEGAVAVRSSVTAEDMEEASFAGIYETYLNIRGPESVIEYVKLCWASVWNERVPTYCRTAGIDHLKADVAVVVQRMAQAEVSGVMFTTNPLTAHPGEIVIDAVRGLGENLVSGKVQPDHFVLKKSTGRIKRSKLSSNMSRDADHTNENDSKKPCLIESDLRRLAEVGRRIELEMGCPQDVEWAIEDAGAARIALLQSRPITTLPPSNETVFTRKMGDQYWTDVISPLTFTCGVNWIVDGAFIPLIGALGFKELANLEFFRLHKSHLYMNTRMARESITMFPMSARKQFTDSMGSPHDDEYFLEAPYRPIRGFISLIRAHLTDKRSGMSRNLRALEEWSHTVKDKIAGMLLSLEQKPNIEELMEMFDEINRMGVEHFEIIRWGHASYNTTLTDAFRAMCEKWADDDDGSIFLRITGHLDSNVTMDCDQALWEVARRIESDSTARDIFLTLEPDEAARRILEKDDCPEAQSSFKSFLENYGHRTTSRDITVPHWMDAPGQVAGIIGGILAEELPPSPHSRSEAARLRSEEAMIEALGRIRKKWYGFFIKRWFEYTARQARVFIGYRENQRFTLDRIMYLIRRTALAIGEWLTKREQLDCAEDVFFLEREEMTEAVGAKRLDPDIRSRIPGRRRELETNRDILPPAYLMGSFEFEDQTKDEEELPPGEYAGLNAAPGVVDGPARVLTELEDAHLLRAGEVLVTESTDPAWSAAFMKVAGLVLETGGLLSHGAILAREFGVPAVTHVSGAASFIRTGDRIRVDGTRGRVIILTTKENK